MGLINLSFFFPDVVSRTDCRGVNLNRIYSKPSLAHHPPIYAARKLLLYAHYAREVKESEAQHATGPEDVADRSVSGGRDRRVSASEVSTTSLDYTKGSPSPSNKSGSSSASLASSFRVLRSSLESEVCFFGFPPVLLSILK